MSHSFMEFDPLNRKADPTHMDFDPTADEIPPTKPIRRDGSGDEQVSKEGPLYPLGDRGPNAMDGCLVLVAICMFGFFFVCLAVQAFRETFAL